MNHPARRFLASILVPIALTPLAAACGGGGGGPSGHGGTSSGGATSSGGGTSSGGEGAVSLAVNMATSPDKIGPSSPAQGRSYVEINITLQDVSTPAPIPVAFAYYSLTTANGLVLAPSVASSAVGTPCPGDISIGAGSQFTCDVVFEVPTQDSPKELAYDDHAGHTATAAVTVTPPPPPDPCETVAAWQNGTSTACVQCKTTICKTQRDEWLAEENDGHTCPEWNNCTMMNCTPANLCPCQGTCAGACKPAWYAYLECIIDNCVALCM